MSPEKAIFLPDLNTNEIRAPNFKQDSLLQLFDEKTNRSLFECFPVFRALL